MADNNDVFSVLGKVEVDLGALRASLGGAEAEIVASTNRQKKTYTEFANAVVAQQQRINEASSLARAGSSGSGLYNMLYGPGGTGNPNGNGAGAAAGEAAKKTAEGLKNVGHHAGVSMMAVRGFSHIINELVPGLGGMASGLLNISVHLGPLGALVLVAVSAFAIYAERIKEVEKVQYEMGQSLKTLDFDRLNKVVQEANENLDKFAFRQEKANQELKDTASLVSIVTNYWANFYAKVTGKGPEEAKHTIEETEKAWIKLYNSIGGPGGKMALENQKAQAEAMNQAAQFAVGLADTLDDTSAAYDKLASATQKSREATIAGIEADYQNFLLKNKIAEGSEKAKAVRVQYDEKIRIENEKGALEDRKQAEERKKKLAEITTAEIESALKIIDIRAKRADSARALAIAETRAEQEVAQTRARLAGQTVSGADSVTAVYRLEREQIEETEKKSQERYDKESANLKKLIADDVDTAANKRKLAELTETRETEAGDAANKLREKQKGLQKDLANEAARVYEAEFSRIRATTEAYFGLRKALGQDTIHDEIRSQEALNNLYVKGTAEYYNGLAKVASLQKQMRDEARGTFNSIAGEAIEELKKAGRKQITMADITKKSDEIAKRSEGTLSDFGGGKAVDADAILKAVNRQPNQERFEAQGGNLRDLFDRAITQRAGFAPAGTSTFAGGSTLAPGEDPSKLIKAAGDLFRTGVADFRDAVDAFVSKATDGSSEGMGRTLYIEQKRGPIQTESAQ